MAAIIEGSNTARAARITWGGGGEQRRKPVERDLNILQWNADAILSSREELKEYVKRKSVDIWCIQEKKLIEKDETPQVQGYTMIRKDRKQARGRESNRGGGLLMGKKEDIPYKVVQKEFGGPKDNITEGMTIEIPLRNNQKLRITNMYIPPIRRTEQEEERGRRGEICTDLWLSERYDMLLTFRVN